MELLREGEAFLLKVVQRQGRALEETREREAQRSEWVPEMVGYPLGRRPGEDSPAAGGPKGRMVTSRIRDVHDSPAEDREQRREGTPKTGEAESQPKDGAPLLGVQVPPPDDDVPGRGWNNSPARFFQKCYDRYHEHYEGYVRLAERLHSMRDEDSPLGRRGSEDKLAGVRRHRADYPEAAYARGALPELATDNDRISSRIGTARPLPAHTTLRPLTLNKAPHARSPLTAAISKSYSDKLKCSNEASAPGRIRTSDSRFRKPGRGVAPNCSDLRIRLI